MPYRDFEPTVDEKTASLSEVDNEVEASQRQTALGHLWAGPGSPPADAGNALRKSTNGRLSRAGNTLLHLQQQYGNQYVQRVVNQAQTIQRKELGEQDTIQRQPRQPNNTGLPDQLKHNLEQMSGLDMSDVRVHRYSSKPAEVQALAYTQGSDIHLGAGQEKHLPHEAWHVVQQKQGRVEPTGHLYGAPINDDVKMEAEATMLGRQAVVSSPARSNGKTTLKQGFRLGSIGSRAVTTSHRASPLQFTRDAAINWWSMKKKDNAVSPDTMREIITTGRDPITGEIVSDHNRERLCELNNQNLNRWDNDYIELNNLGKRRMSATTAAATSNIPSHKRRGSLHAHKSSQIKPPPRQLDLSAWSGLGGSQDEMKTSHSKPKSLPKPQSSMRNSWANRQKSNQVGANHSKPKSLPKPQSSMRNSWANRQKSNLVGAKPGPSLQITNNLSNKPAKKRTSSLSELAKKSSSNDSYVRALTYLQKQLTNKGVSWRLTNALISSVIENNDYPQGTFDKGDIRKAAKVWKDEAKNLEKRYGNAIKGNMHVPGHPTTWFAPKSRGKDRKGKTVYERNVPFIIGTRVHSHITIHIKWGSTTRR